MDDNRQTLLRILSASPRLLARAQADFSTSPKQLIEKIIAQSGPHAAVLHLSQAGLKTIKDVDFSAFTYSEHAVYSESYGFVSDQVFDNAFLPEPVTSYSPDVSDILNGKSADLEWSKSYMSAELGSLSLYGATGLCREGDSFYVEFGAKKLPFRNLSLIERGFVTQSARVSCEHPFFKVMMQKVCVSMKSTSRSLFFLCGDFKHEDVERFFSKNGLSIHIVDFDGFRQSAKDILSRACHRKEQYLVLSSAVDSVSLYAAMRSFVDKDLFMATIGGIWSCQVLPKLCCKCKKTTKSVVVNKVEHGITLGGVCADSGGGCSHCLYGYSGTQCIEETINEDTLSFFIAAVERFEKKKQENPGLQPLSMLSEYAVDGKIESIYQVLSKHLKLLNITNGDAQLLLL